MSAYTTIADYFIAFDQYFCCDAHLCRHSAKLDCVKLAAVFGWDFPMAEIRRRMKCSKCGRRECRIVASGRPDVGGNIAAERQQIVTNTGKKTR